MPRSEGWRHPPRDCRHCYSYRAACVLAMTASQSESGSDIDEERRRELLNRIRYMATSGLYADHTAINAQLSLNIDYPLVSECFADEVFRTHIDEMCSRVRKEHSANGTSDAGLNTRSD